MDIGNVCANNIGNVLAAFMPHERQNEIELIANGICIHQLLLPAKFYIFNAATIRAATNLELLQNLAVR